MVLEAMPMGQVFQKECYERLKGEERGVKDTVAC